MLLDVRTVAEVEAGTIPGARHIPLEELRERLGELPRGQGAAGLLPRRPSRLRGLPPAGQPRLPLPQPDRRLHDLPRRDRNERHLQARGDRDESRHRGDRPATAAATAAEPLNVEIAREIDAIGLQCPGPIMRLRAAVAEIPEGRAVRIKASDPAFQQDVAAWCHSTGNRLAEVGRDNGTCLATIVKSRPGRGAGRRLPPRPPPPAPRRWSSSAATWTRRWPPSSSPTAPPPWAAR